MASTRDRWTTRAGTRARVPSGYDEERAAFPDELSLAEAGFEYMGAHTFPTEYDWTVDGLIGFTYSSSVLSREALGALATPFEDDLRRELSAYEQSGVLPSTLHFAYELARRPMREPSLTWTRVSSARVR